MRRSQLEHVLRAARTVTEETDFVVIGSQALLGTISDPPRALCHSLDVDLYPMMSPGKSDLLDGAIGELSQFHAEFGYYAHGVSPETAVLPRNWKDRAVRLSTEAMNGAIAHCLHPLDVAYSKLAAGREKDMDYVREMIRCRIIKSGTLEQIVQQETAESGFCDLILSRLSQCRSAKGK